MSAMRLALLLLRRSRPRLVLAVGALALAAAGVCAIDLVNRAVLRAFVEVIDTMAGRAALQVTAADGSIFPVSVAKLASDTPGVTLAVPLVTATTVTDRGDSVSVYGLNFFDGRVVRVYEPQGLEAFNLDLAVLASRRVPIIVARGLADRHGLRVGDEVALETPAGRRPFVVSGIVETEGMTRLLGPRFAVTHLDVAQTAFARFRFINRVDVVVERARDVEDVAAALRARLPTGLVVAAPIARRVDLQRVMRALEVMLWGAALIGVGLAVLIAFNRLATEFEAQAWQAAVVRAAGMRAGAVWRVLLLEGFMLGIAGATIGLPLGVVIGKLLLPAVAGTAEINYTLTLPAVDLDVRPWSLALGAATAIGAALVAASLPAWRAAHVPLARTLGGRGVEQPARSPVGTGTVRALVSLALGGAIALHLHTGAAAWGLLATGLAVLATAVWAGALVAAANRLLPHVLATVAGSLGVLVGGGIVRNARRTSLTVATVGVGMGAVVWLVTLAAGFEASVVRTLAATLRAELIVASSQSAGGWVPAPVPGRLIEELATLPGVAGVAGNRIADATYRGRGIVLNAFDPEYFAEPAFGQSELLGEPPRDVWQAVAEGTSAIVSTNFARNFGTALGDTIVLETPRGPLMLRVVGFTMAFMSPGGTVEMSRVAYARLFDDDRVNRVWVRTARDADSATVRDAIATRLGGKYDLRVWSSDEMRGYLVSQVRRAFAPVEVLRVLVLAVLLLGICDTLVAGVLERVRELGLSRAVGMRRRQIMCLVLLEAAVIGALGLGLATTLGLSLGVLWTHATLPALLGWTLVFSMPHMQLTVAALLTAAVCLLAGLPPARRAARLAPAAALRYD